MTTTEEPPTASQPGTIEELADLLRRLYRSGIRHPATLLHSPYAADTIRLITGHTPPADDHARLHRLTQAHTRIRAAVDAIGEPETGMLRHLLDLHDDRTRVRGGIEKRREQAARIYSTDPTKPISGASFQRRPERRITVLLAAEIISQTGPQPHPAMPTATFDPQGTHQAAAPAPRTPPPPATAFRPRRP
ncbi:hypothetical protein [Parafrankia elaeagni]|uniref:hypothetical protein n=1 Tax=Parafrankia elaeagni TaxID=222534 RepID=UPI0003820033|nr:hypothetical protein [Parafrankia elaeagni]